MTTRSRRAGRRIRKIDLGINPLAIGLLLYGTLNLLLALQRLAATDDALRWNETMTMTSEVQLDQEECLDVLLQDHGIVTDTVTGAKFDTPMLPTAEVYVACSAGRRTLRLLR